ncbi:MAG: lipocalin family protein [Bacteroidaceae bacterium]|nr:lipocalin family protein [Bacteroidaceae bacterium]
MKTVKYICAAATALLLCACESKAPRQEVDEPEFIVPEDFSENASISGIVTSVEDDIIAVLTEAGDTCSFAMTEALANQKVYGGYAVNDYVVVVPDNGDNAEELLNLTTLAGRWVMKNVAEEESGINIKEGGIASSINNDTQNFSSWTMDGTRLLLTWSGDGSDGTSELVDTCDIRYLSKDTLKIVSSYDPTLTTTYYRQK